MSTKENKPGSLKWWITLVIAILTALAGMLTEAKTSVVASALDLPAETINQNL